MFNGWAQLSYINSLLDFHRCRIQFSLMGIANESLICRARNSCISYFNHLKQYSHLCFIDGDVGFSGESLIKLISRDKDVIGVPVALRGFNKETGKPVYNVGNFIRQEGELFTTDRIGTAVFMLSRKAVDSLISIADQYQSNKHTMGDAIQIPHYDVFKTGVTNGQYESEDFWCAKTLVELGYEIWVDPTLPVIHTAMWQFS